MNFVVGYHKNQAPMHWKIMSHDEAKSSQGKDLPKSESTGRGKDLVPLPDDFVPGPNHVICAKGSKVKQHPANRLLKSLVQTHLSEYSACESKLERSFLVSKILKTCTGGTGGFVRNINGKWYDIGSRNSKEKIGQSFRDSLHTQFRSSTKAKASYRKKLSQNSEGSMSSSNTTDRDRTSSSPVPPPKKKLSLKFPISEVSFDQTGPKPDIDKSETDFDWKDLEPLPLGDSAIFSSDGDISSSTTASALNSGSAHSMPSAMASVARSQISCSALSSTTAPSRASTLYDASFRPETISSAHPNFLQGVNMNMNALSGLNSNAIRASDPTPAAVPSMPFTGGGGPMNANATSQVSQTQFNISSMGGNTPMFPNYNPSNFAPGAFQQQPTPVQFASMQQHLYQQQQQQQQQQQGSNSNNASNNNSRNVEDEFIQEFLKAQWQRQFE